MRRLFYELVTWITNMITGLDNDHLRLSTNRTWIKASNEVAMWLNIVCLLVIILVVSLIISAITNMYQKRKKLHSY